MKHVNSEQLGCVRRRNVFEECYAKHSGAVAGPNMQTLIRIQNARQQIQKYSKQDEESEKTNAHINNMLRKIKRSVSATGGHVKLRLFIRKDSR